MTEQNDKNQVLPGNPALPSPPEVFKRMAEAAEKGGVYRVEDFYTMPEVSSYHISQYGSYLSWLKRNEKGKRDIWIRERHSGKSRLVVEEGENVIRGFVWKGDETIVYLQDSGGDENYHIYVKNIKTNESKDLTPFKGVRVMISSLQPDHENFLIIEMNKENRELFEPYRLDLTNGNLEKLYDNPPSEEPISSYLFDKNGVLRFFTRVVNGLDTAWYYRQPDGAYELLLQHSFEDNFSVIGFDYLNDNPDVGYVLSNLESDKGNVYLYDFKEKKAIKEIFANETYDAEGIRLSRKRHYELDAIFYEGDKPETVPVSQTYREWLDYLYEKLGKNNEIHIVDHDDAEEQLIVYVTSDREPGVYYLYEPKNGKLELLTKLFPHLDREKMSSMEPISFKSRDGLTLHGYFSRPAGVPKDTRLPVVVIVHGGPQGIRDSWGFNAQNQVLTSHGFGVLQVNFRISGGYGKAFCNAGLGQVGRKAMDDVEDGVHYVVEQGWADPARIAIYGGSHGGFAVLRGLVKTPDLYACGVDYVGVSNLFTFIETIPPYWESYRKMLYTIWYDPNDPEERAIMEEVSPLHHADKIKKPLFVIQGANDPRVNIDEADQIVGTLRERGIDVPYMVKYDEGHGFAKEANRLEMQKAMVGFLMQNLF